MEFTLFFLAEGNVSSGDVLKYFLSFISSAILCQENKLHLKMLKVQVKLWRNSHGWDVGGFAFDVFFYLGCLFVLFAFYQESLQWSVLCKFPRNLCFLKTQGHCLLWPSQLFAVILQSAIFLILK